MDRKTALLGLVAAAVCVVPVVARGSGNGHGTTNNAHGVNAHVLGTGVLCDDDTFFSQGGVSKWVNNHGHWSFVFGSANGTGSEGNDGDQVGLRLEALNQPANNFGFDWNTTNSVDPDILIYLTNSSGEFQYGVYNLFSLLQFGTTNSGYTITSLGNNVYRVRFDAANATRIHSPSGSGPIAPGTRWNNIYVYEGNDENGIQSLSNVFVNNHPVTPNLQPVPQSDCTPFDFSGGS